MGNRKGRRMKRREHVYRRPKDRPGLKFTGSHPCPECGKWCYATRADAEASARQLYPGATIRYYQCESTGQVWWHLTSMNADQQADVRARSTGTDDEWDDGAEEVA